MSEKVEGIRNIALVAHGGAGKTSLAEAMLFDAGVITRLGRIDEGNTALDFEPEEIKRTSSISTGLHQLPWKKHTLTLLDTPGDQNFFSDTKTCLQAADAAVVVIDAVDGIKVQTEIGWEFLEDFKLPRAIFINKLDRERADFRRTFDEAKEMLQPKPIILQLPIGAEAGFKGLVDLISQKAYVYGGDGKAKASEIPADMKDEVEAERDALIENIAEADDALVERYLEGETLTEDELRAALRKGTLARTFTPVLCGSSTANIGVDLFMDFVVAAMPSPADRPARIGKDPASGKEVERNPDPAAPFSALVFKTITDPYAGRLTIFRVLSGTIGGDGTFYNAKKEVRERFNQLLVILGKEQKPVEGAGAGSIVAVAKLKETGTGDTLCDEAGKIRYDSVPPIPTLISYAVSAKTKGDEDKGSPRSRACSRRTPRCASSGDRARPRRSSSHGQGQIHIEIADRAAQAQVRRRGPAERAQGALPGDDQEEGARAGPPQEADRRARPVRRLLGAASSRCRGARGSSSSTRSSGAPSRASSSRRSKRGSSSPPCKGVAGRLSRCVDFRATALRRLLPRGRLLGNGLQDRRLAWPSARRCRAGRPGPAGARHEGDRHRSGRVHGRHHGRPEQPPRTGARHGKRGQEPVHQRLRAHGRDLRPTPRTCAR